MPGYNKHYLELSLLVTCYRVEKLFGKSIAILSLAAPNEISSQSGDANLDRRRFIRVLF